MNNTKKTAREEYFRTILRVSGSFIIKLLFERVEELINTLAEGLELEGE